MQRQGQPSTLPGETIVAGNTPSSGYATGLAPGGLLEDSTGSHLYVTDNAGDVVIGYSITANGVPTPLPNGVATTDLRTAWAGNRSFG